jgi:hypothetical protein
MRSAHAHPANLDSCKVPSLATASAPDPDAAAPPKLQVVLLIGSGIVASAQIGKAIISLPMIRADLSLGLDLAGLIVATFALPSISAGAPRPPSSRQSPCLVSRSPASSGAIWRRRKPALPRLHP